MNDQSRAESLTKELTALALRGIGDAFRLVGGKPYTATILFEIVGLLQAAKWQGSAAQKTEALRATILSAILLIEEKSIQKSSITQRSAVLRLYDFHELAPISPEHERSYEGGAVRYKLLVHVLMHELNRPGETNPNRFTLPFRQLLAEKLLELEKQALNPVPPEEPHDDTVPLEDNEAESADVFHEPRTVRRFPQGFLLGLALIVTLVVLAGVAIWLVGKTGSKNVAAPSSLHSTLTNAQSATGIFSVVFPEDRGATAEKYFTRRKELGFDVFSTFREELDDGAYSLGGIVVTVELEGEANKEVTIYNVRPVSLKQEPIITGTVFFENPQGDKTSQIAFNLDSPVPIGTIFDWKDPHYGEPFFQVERIGLVRNAKHTLSLHFLARSAAYSFQIAIDYEVGGVKRTELVKNDAGDPFTARVTASLRLCDLASLPASDSERLGRLKYSKVYQPPTDRTKGIPLESLDPTRFVNIPCQSNT